MSGLNGLPTPRRAFWATALGVVVALLAVTSPMLVEEVGPDEYVVIQSPGTGTLTWYTAPGWAWQGYGTATHYPRVVTVVSEKGQELRFNDGGHGTMFSSVQFRIPADTKMLNAINSNYHGQDNLRSGLLEPAVVRSIYLSGPLMSSRESYAEKRNDLIHYITDQIQNGIYRTHQRTDFVKDEVSGQMKPVVFAEIVRDKDGKADRQEPSALAQLGIEAYNFTISNLPYDQAIEKQIRQQQEITMAVQTKIAEAKQAEQAALTAEAEGRANATRERWKQEAIKAVETTRADQEKQVAITQAEKDKAVAETAATQRMNVADLDRKAAEQKKLELILLGEGEAQRKKLVLDADGALAQKLDAWTTSQKYWADALARHQGAITPTTVFGGSGASGAPTNAVQSFMDILSANAAQQLQLNMQVRK